MNQRANEVRNRIMKRKNNQMRNLHVEKKIILNSPYQYGDVEFTKDTRENLNREIEGNTFILRLLSSILLVSLVAIIFQFQQKNFIVIQNKIVDVFEGEFQFAKVGNWYESTFGEPLTFLTSDKVLDNHSEVIQTSGKVLENFQVNGQGIMIETTVTKVEAFEEGLVIYAGEKDDLGKTVIVQNVDGSETWYGQLDGISVDVYDEVKKGDEIAVTSVKDNSENGTYYLAIKKNNEFIDPNQVILFE